MAKRSAKSGTAGTTLQWMFTTLDGTVDTYTNASNGSTARSFRDPYGVPIGGNSGVWADGTGFMNKPASAKTKLTTVGARTYDPLLGKFTAVDPVIDANLPQQNTGYTYSGNNPTTYSDPTGLRFEGVGCGGCRYLGDGVVAPPSRRGEPNVPRGDRLAPSPQPGPAPQEFDFAKVQDDLLRRQAEYLVDNYPRELNRMLRAQLDSDLREKLNKPINDAMKSILDKSGVACVVASNGLNVCNVDDWPSGGTTVGDYFVTQIRTQLVLSDQDLLQHEQTHSAGWAGFGAEFVALYVRFELESQNHGLGPACGNFFESYANLPGGHYQC